jgi:hypothetical protein
MSPMILSEGKPTSARPSAKEDTLAERKLIFVCNEKENLKEEVLITRLTLRT